MFHFLRKPILEGHLKLLLLNGVLSLPCPDENMKRCSKLMLMANISLIIVYFKTLPRFKGRQYMCLPGEKKRHLYELDYLKLKI